MPKTKKYIEQDQINDLIITLNELRVKQGKPVVERQWTGVAYWLSYRSNNGYGYSSVGNALLKSKEEFISFLQGMLVTD